MRRAAGVIVFFLTGAGLLAQAPAVKVVPVGPGPRAVPAGEGGTRFDPQKAELSYQGRRWRITHDGAVLKDFGSGEQEARHALQVIRQLGLDEVARVGAGMEYWLAGGKPPAAPPAGVRTVSFDPGSVRVERLHGQWCVRDGARVLCVFGG